MERGQDSILMKQIPMEIRGKNTAQAPKIANQELGPNLIDLLIAI